jgi:hypothetical protein
MSLLFAPTLIAGEKESKSIRGDIQLSLHWDPAPPTWEGTIDGDIEGEFDINLIGANFDYPKPDPSQDEMVWEFYWEEWEVETKEGTITVIMAGVWSFETFKFVANGPVVAATGEWEYLTGSTVYCSGVTSEFPVDPPTPVTGEGEMWIDL